MVHREIDPRPCVMKKVATQVGPHMADGRDQRAGDARDLIADQGGDDHVRPGRHLRDREQVGELLVGHPVLETSTASRCISGIAALAPPIANSDSMREIRRQREQRIGALHRRCHR